LYILLAYISVLASYNGAPSSQGNAGATAASKGLGMDEDPEVDDVTVKELTEAVELASHAEALGSGLNWPSK
jgi:hypothetical protein